MRTQLFDHQVRALDKLRESLRSGHKRPVLMSPTGSGKTVVAAAITHSARQKGKRVLFTVPLIELVDQTVARFAEHGAAACGLYGDVGVVQAKHVMEDASRPIQVCSVQSLARRDQIPEFDVAMVDECHIWFEYYERLFDSTDKPIIGMSATPWAKGLGLWYDDLIVPTTMRELQQTINPLTGRTFLTPYKVFAPSRVDLSGVKSIGGDYHVGELSKVMRGRKIVGDVAKTWCERGEGRPTLAFCVDCEHAKTLEQQFRDLNVPVAYVDADTKKPDREEIRKKFASGEVKVVVNIGVLTAGVDWDVRAVIDARPTKSKMLFVQMLGRGARPAEGKTECLVLSHSNNFLAHGYPQDVIRNSLRTAKREIGIAEFNEPKIPTPCPECHALYKCEHRRGPTQAEFLRGELAELDPFFLPGEQRPKPPKPETYTPEQKQAFYSGLSYIAGERGYQRGWIANQFREKFGVWPRGFHDIPMPPGPDVLSWEHSQRIRYAKRREAQH